MMRTTNIRSSFAGRRVYPPADTTHGPTAASRRVDMQSESPNLTVAEPCLSFPRNSIKALCCYLDSPSHQNLSALDSNVDSRM